MESKKKSNNKRPFVVMAGIVVLVLISFFMGSANGKSDSAKRADQLAGDIQKKEETLKSLDASIDSKNKTLSETNEKIKTAEDKLNKTNKLVEEKNSIHIKGEVKKSLERGMTKLVGEIENGTNNSTDYWKVTATFYDGDGKVIGTSYTNSSDELKSGATAPFEITSYPEKFDAASWKLDVAWN